MDNLIGYGQADRLSARRAYRGCCKMHPTAATAAAKKDVGRRFAGWEKIAVKTADGVIKPGTAPVIVSASRATDLPAFYGDWFVNRLRKGYLVKRYPRNPQKTELVSFANTRLVIFWTKNANPLVRHLDEIERQRIGFYFQFTLNDYDSDNLEPHVPKLDERIGCFKRLAKRIGKEKVIWRFDPLILTDAITRDVLIEKVHGLMVRLSGYTEKLVISFMKADRHKKVVHKLNRAGVVYRNFTMDDIGHIAGGIGEMGKAFGIDVAACAEAVDLSPYGIGRNKCIDDDLIRRVFSHDAALMKFIGNGKGLTDSGQRKSCRCIVSKDIGEYHTCRHLCRYCYANISDRVVRRNVERITQTDEMLLPPPKT